jgi:hypothetical protein
MRGAVFRLRPWFEDLSAAQDVREKKQEFQSAVHVLIRRLLGLWAGILEVGVVWHVTRSP